MVLQVLDLVATSAGSEPFYGDCPTSYTNLDVNTTAQPTCTVIPQGKYYFTTSQKNPLLNWKFYLFLHSEIQILIIFHIPSQILLRDY